MQSLPREILTNIFNFLPWNVAIRLESLASQFRDLPYEKSYLSILTIKTLHNWRTPLCFSICAFDCEETHSLLVNYDELFELDIQEKWINRGKSRENLLKMKRDLRIYRLWKDVEPLEVIKFSAQIYQKLLRRFSFETVEFENLPAYFYNQICAKKTDIFRRTMVKFLTDGQRLDDSEVGFLKRFGGEFWDPSDSQNGLRVNKIFEQESIEFSEVRLFQFIAASNFEEAANLWNLSCIQLSRQLRIHFGDKSSLNLRFTINRVNLEVDDILLQKLIDRKTLILQTNGVSSVTLDFLCNYIQDCFAGRTHVMHYLEMSFENNLLDQLSQRLRAMQFRNETSWCFEKNVENRPCREGYDSDKIRVETLIVFKMIADFGEFRGRKSCSRGIKRFTYTIQ